MPLSGLRPLVFGPLHNPPSPDFDPLCIHRRPTSRGAFCCVARIARLEHEPLFRLTRGHLDALFGHVRQRSVRALTLTRSAFWTILQAAQKSKPGKIALEQAFHHPYIASARSIYNHPMQVDSLLLRGGHSQLCKYTWGSMPWM